MPGKWGGARRARPPLDPPMNVVYQELYFHLIFIIYETILMVDCWFKQNEGNNIFHEELSCPGKLIRQFVKYHFFS